jgi:precorrin-8X/cobalt-precorrin-8 methylmutase
MKDTFQDKVVYNPATKIELSGKVKEIALSNQRSPDFDAYLVVDWSANKSPKLGKDSIWWCLAEWSGLGLCIIPPKNVSTRVQACADIEKELVRLAGENKSVMVGFDFAYGYPRGTAAALGLSGPPWFANWNYFASRIVDQQTLKQNNRFCIAAGMNISIGAAGGGPFWGVPGGVSIPGVIAKKPSHFPLPEFRLVEGRVSGAKSVWQLFYNGSVGSQVLMGIPTLNGLRHSPNLAAISKVWPFETGPHLPLRKNGSPRIIHAEVYPSLIRIVPKSGQVMDKAQVLALVQYFAELDASNKIGALFSAPTRHSGICQRAICLEEGWILGVQ